uniref:Claudin n=2 Tax=Petromyzon marinus TaxID=7757 RepID=S4R8E0_PETMA
GVTLAMHVVGFALSTLGFGLTVMVIYLNCWSIYSHGPGTYMQSGLWNICVRNASTERGEVCRQFYTALSQPRFFQVVRALMLMAVAVGAIALFVSTLGTACARRFSEHASTKTKLTCAGGTLWLLTVLCSRVVCSSFGVSLVTEFPGWLRVSPTSPGGGVGGLSSFGELQTLYTRFSFGAALYTGWLAGAFIVIGGALM